MFRLVQIGIPWEVAEKLTVEELQIASLTSASMLEASQNKGQGDVDTNYANMAAYFGGNT